MDVLRTPTSGSPGLPDFPFAPHYVEIAAGDGRATLRVHYLDEGDRPTAPGRAAHARRAVVVLPVPAHDPGARRRRAARASPPTSSASAAPTSRPRAPTTRTRATSTGCRSFVRRARPRRRHARVPGLGRADRPAARGRRTRSGSPASSPPTRSCRPATRTPSDAFLAWQKFSQDVDDVPDRRDRQRGLHDRPRARGDRRRTTRRSPTRPTRPGRASSRCSCRRRPTTPRPPPTGPRGRCSTQLRPAVPLRVLRLRSDHRRAPTARCAGGSRAAPASRTRRSRAAATSSRRTGAPSSPGWSPTSSSGREHVLARDYPGAMDELGYDAFDADNHYYEALDAFTRHLDPEARAPQRAVGRDQRAPVPRRRRPREPRRREPDVRPDRQGRRDARLLPRQPRRARARSSSSATASRSGPSTATATPGSAAMDEQGLEKIWLFPTLGMLYEELLKHDVEAVTLTFTAFNRWLEEDWGCNYRDRIFAAPYISLCDVDWAVRELEWALDHDARVVVMRPRGAHHRHRARSRPTDPMFDPFWARANEAGITVVVHAGDSGYSSQGYAKDDRSRPAFQGGGWQPSVRTFAIERAAYDFLITLVVRQAVRAVPEPAHRVGRERLGVPPRPVQEAALDRAQDARLLRRGPGARASASTCGSTRSGRTTSTRSSTSWAPTA